MPRWLVCALAAGCAWPTIVVLDARGDAALAGPSIGRAGALRRRRSLALIVAAAGVRGVHAVRPRLLAAAGAAWLADRVGEPRPRPARCCSPPDSSRPGLALPLVLAATLPPRTRGSGGDARRRGRADCSRARCAAIAGGPRACTAAPTARATCSRSAPIPTSRTGSPASARGVDRGLRGSDRLVRARPRRAAARARASLGHGARGAFAAATGRGCAIALRDGQRRRGVRTAHLAAAAALLAIALATRARPCSCSARAPRRHGGDDHGGDRRRGPVGDPRAGGRRPVARAALRVPGRAAGSTPAGAPRAAGGGHGTSR